MAIVSLPLGGSVPKELRGGAITIGNFDGVHLGHQALLAEVVRQAKTLSGPAVAVTFVPHPLQLLKPATFEPELTTPRQRAELLQKHGADHVVVLETTPVLLQLRAAEFFEHIIRERLAARAIVEGCNFGFGKNREGSAATLQSLGKATGIDVILVPAVEVQGRAVSSSRVRHEVLVGNVNLAAILLGRPFRLVGTVTPGQKRGKTLGFPTANLDNIATLVPGNGVYAVRAFLGNQAWPGAAHVGPNPTFGENARKIEVHLIGFAGDLYGESLEVDFLEKLRDTRPFAGAQELKAQLAMDVARARAVCNGENV